MGLSRDEAGVGSTGALSPKAREVLLGSLNSTLRVPTGDFKGGTRCYLHFWKIPLGCHESGRRMEQRDAEHLGGVVLCPLPFLLGGARGSPRSPLGRAGHRRPRLRTWPVIGLFSPVTRGLSLQQVSAAAGLHSSTFGYWGGGREHCPSELMRPTCPPEPEPPGPGRDTTEASGAPTRVLGNTFRRDAAPPSAARPLF